MLSRETELRHTTRSHIARCCPRSQHGCACLVASGELSHSPHPAHRPGGGAATARALLLDEAVPLLTLTGPGGVGKTRLALAIAAGRGRRTSPTAWSGSIWLPLADPALVPTRDRQRPRRRPSRASDPIEAQLVRHLRPRQTLLLLDNCEHLLAAVADLVGSPAGVLSRAAGAGHQPRSAADSRGA